MKEKLVFWKKLTAILGVKLIDVYVGKWVEMLLIEGLIEASGCKKKKKKAAWVKKYKLNFRVKLLLYHDIPWMLCHFKSLIKVICINK